MFLKGSTTRLSKGFLAGYHKGSSGVVFYIRVPFRVLPFKGAGHIFGT